MPGTGQKAPDRLEPQTVAIRSMYVPLFRKHHVAMIVAGHDHLYDHWVEHYVDNGVTYRMDSLVTGGGGAPIYPYVGEPDLRAYVAANAAQSVRVEHLMKPGLHGRREPASLRRRPGGRRSPVARGDRHRPGGLRAVQRQGHDRPQRSRVSWLKLRLGAVADA